MAGKSTQSDSGKDKSGNTMFRWFLSFFSRRPTMKVWAIKYDLFSHWTKVVSIKKPIPSGTGGVLGPFRSEVDCEEFCDYSNRRYGSSAIYNKQS